MKVNNKKCVRKIAMRSLMANKRRNIITIAAIILTAVLFTTLFTITLSINASYEKSIFRQLGGSNHGTFKDLTDDQLTALTESRLIKAYGVRTIAGIIEEAPFTKLSAEVSYMDDNCAEWSFIKLDEGHMPQAYNEVIMDTESLRLLGKEPVLGQEIELSFNILGMSDPEAKVTGTFVLTGYWEYDPLCPAHFINVSEDYIDDLGRSAVEIGYDSFRTDLNVMFSSSFDIPGKMEKVLAECGFTSEDAGSENYVRFGVNPGFTMSGVSDGLSAGMLLPILAFSLLVVFTGYLIIYNVFQISVASDIRFYGLLKTIGTTGKQLKRIIRDQALVLCVIGIPLGLLLGYGLGAVLTPAVLKTTTISLNSLTISTSPVIFIGAAVFELVTVLISVSKPGRMAGKVSPVEALRYTEGSDIRKKKKTTRGAKVTGMAFANMERNKKKTVLVFVSIALSLVILNAVYLFVGGFDSEKWLDTEVYSDFLVGNVDYFKFQGAGNNPLDIREIEEIKENITVEEGGFAYDVAGIPLIKVDDRAYDEFVAKLGGVYGLANDAGEGMHYIDCKAEGMDEYLVDRLEVYEGDASLLNDADGRYIAIITHADEYGNLYLDENAPKIGDTLTFAVAEEVEVIQDAAGGRIGFNGLKESEFTVCAYVGVPTAIGPRRGSYAYDVVLGSGALREAMGDTMVPMFYAFDTPSMEEELRAEAFLSNYCENTSGLIEYESKASKRGEFENFKNMFALLGGVLCLVIGFVGVLNFLNTVMAGIISRKNELAVMQAIGMTGKQVKEMLMTEGLIYTVGSGIIALVLSLAFTPIINYACEDMFWFYSGHVSVMPFVYVMPVIAVLGVLVPLIAYRNLSRASIVERIREIG